MTLEVQQISLEKEYAKHKNLSPEDIKQLREWLKTQPHLPEQHITDLDLILTYHCCDQSFQRSKDVLDLNLTSRTLITYMYGCREVDEKVIDAAKTMVMTPLYEADDGTRYIYAGLIRFETKYFHYTDVVRLFMMIVDLWQYEDGTWPWFSIVVDLRSVTWAHITKIDLMLLKQFLCFLQECILVRMKNIYFINSPSFIDKFLALLRPLMKKELFDKIQVFTSDSQELYKIIPKKALLKDCGGENLSGQEISEYLVKRLQDNKKYFKEENFKRINKSLRPDSKLFNIEDLLGIQGSFKKLDID